MSVTKEEKILIPEGLSAVVYEVATNGDASISYMSPESKFRNQWISGVQPHKMKIIGTVDIPVLKKGLEIEIIEDFMSNSKPKVLIPKRLRTVVYDFDSNGNAKISYQAPGSKFDNQWVSPFDFHKVKIV